MKKIKAYSVKILFTTVISIFLLYSCTEEFDYGKSVNAVKTLESSSVLQTTATVSGIVNTDNGSPLTARGICYSTSNNPTIANFIKTDGTATLGNFSCVLENLSPSTTYYIRAYATNSFGTAYGKEISFRTQDATIPIIQTTTETNLITATSAKSGGNITHSGASSVISRGVCFSTTTTTPTISDTKTVDGTGIGTFISSLTGLKVNTIYYVRAYATNGIGTAYGDVKTFTTTAATIPSGITTTALAFITQSTAAGGGNIIDDGGSAITSRGICWSNTTSSPTIANQKTIDGNGIGIFTSSLTGLVPGTTYYVRAYATNGIGTTYGAAVTFTTIAATIPVNITTTGISSITQTSSNSGGSISSDGGSAITGRGVCWSTSTSSPTITGNKTIDGSGAGSFSSSLTGLAPGTTYYVRAYATNSVGTAYGSTMNFKTSPATVPVGVATMSGSSITQTTASSGGSISSDGGSTITAKGVCWSSTNTAPTISNSKSVDGTGTNSFSSSLTGLAPGTTYYIRAYATNSVGTTYGNTLTINTVALSIPIGVTTMSASSISQTTASSGGSISSDGGSTITVKGVCWSSTNTSPTISNSKSVDGTGTNSFNSSLTGLTAATTYYVRAYATNSAGTAYGDIISFTTSAPSITVGQSYQGGIVVYIFKSGDAGYVSGQTHGLIAAPGDQSSGATWGCSGTSISTGTSIGTGASNTTAFINGCSTSTAAARVCYNLSLGGYTDWYLPSLSELQQLYNNRNYIGGFSGIYWSSSQYTSSYGYFFDFGGGNYSYASKSSNYKVRAVRSF